MISVISLKNIGTKRLINTSKILINISNKRYQTTISPESQPNVNPSPEVVQDADKTTTVKQPDFYDIVICGGGMVGTAMARALGRDSVFKNLKIALIESSPKLKEYVQPEIHSNRVCALNDKTVALFKSMESFDYIQKNRHGNVKHMHVWDGSSDSFISFHGQEDNLAIIVENDLIQASLSNDLDKVENLNIFYSSQVKDFNSNSQNVNLKLNDGKEINTKLLIGSDGANSFIRNKSKFKVTKWDYDQVAIVATVKLEEPQTNHTAWQRFLSTGPIALLPLDENYSTLVWSIKKEHAKQLLDLPDDLFAQQINHAFIKEDFKNELASSIEETIQKLFDFVKDSKFLPGIHNLISSTESQVLPPKIETASSRGSFPLSFMHSNNYVKQRIALIGDAVHRVHPLAGQGVNLGFGDVVVLRNALRDNVLNGSEVGSSTYLKNYESTRQKEAFVKAAGIDLLNRLYTDYNYPVKTPLVVLRSVGLTFSNRIAPLKNFFIKQAMQ